MGRHWLMGLGMLLAGCGGTPDEAAFVSTYGDAFCAQNTACNSELSCSTQLADKSSCAYDAQAAADCLSGPWTCNTEYAGYEYAEPPAACTQVWDCAVARR
jgi:hypothetical protein